MLAVRLAVAHEAGARLVQVAGALGALETGGVPLEVWRHAHDELIGDAAAATHARRRPATDATDAADATAAAALAHCNANNVCTS